jgi:hypothetical protein
MTGVAVGMIVGGITVILGGGYPESTEATVGVSKVNGLSLLSSSEVRSAVLESCEIADVALSFVTCVAIAKNTQLATNINNPMRSKFMRVEKCFIVASLAIG